MKMKTKKEKGKRKKEKGKRKKEKGKRKKEKGKGRGKGKGKYTCKPRWASKDSTRPPVPTNFKLHFFVMATESVRKVIKKYT
jgi:hypothetical protein